MPWGNPRTYPLTEASVVLSAPERSGVYALHGVHSLTGARACVYVGEAKDIHSQLIGHLREGDACLAMFRDLTFSYELIAPAALSLRLDELIRELRPICVQHWG